MKIYLLAYVGEEYQEEITEIRSAHQTIEGAQKVAQAEEHELWGEDARELVWKDDSDCDLVASALQSGPYFYCIEGMEVGE